MVDHLVRTAARAAVAAPKLVVLAGLMATLAAGAQLSRLEVDFSSESLLPEADPARIVYDEFRREFGSDAFAIVVLETTDIFHLSVLEKVRELHSRFEAEVPHLRRITSLANGRVTRADGDVLEVVDLGDIWPRGEDEVAPFESFVLGNPLYVGNIVSADARATAVVLELDSYEPVTQEAGATDEGFEHFGVGSESFNKVASKQVMEEEFATAVLAITDRFRNDNPEMAYFASGGPIIQLELASDQANEIGTHAGLAYAVIVLVLAVLFRTLAGVVLPLVVVSLSIVITMGVMPILGFPFTTMSQLLPTFLLVLGAAAAIHVVAAFYQRWEEGVDRAEAIVQGVEECGPAVVLASVTTAVGLGAFLTSNVAPLRGLGVMAAVGALVAMFLTLTVLPALLMLARRRSPFASRGGFVASHLEVVSAAALRHSGVVVLSTVGIVAWSIIGIARLEFSHDPIGWYADGHPVREAVDRIDATMGGTLALQVLLETPDPEGVLEPELIELLHDIEGQATDFSHRGVQAGNALSLAGVVEEIHLALTDGTRAEYRIPETREAIAQEMLLFEIGGGVDIERFADGTRRLARVLVRMPFSDGSDLAPYLEQLRDRFEERARGLASVTLTGSVPLEVRSFNALIEGLAGTYGIAISLVSCLMIVAMRSFRLGLAAMVPNAVPLLFTLGCMGWLGVPLNITTALIGGVIIGISVDDTIHLLAAIRRGYSRSGSVAQATRYAMCTIGPAISCTSLTLGLGFLCYTGSGFSNVREMGVLLSVGVVVAFLSDVLIAPPILGFTTMGRSEAEAAVETEAEEVGP